AKEQDANGNANRIADGNAEGNAKKERKKERSLNAPDAAAFEEFWDAYDKKEGRKAAEQKWTIALRKPGVTADKLITAAHTYVAAQKREGKHPQYTKNATTWLNGEHWNDQPATLRPARRSSDDWMQGT